MWFDRSLTPPPPAQVSHQSCQYCIIIETGDVSSSTRDSDPHGQLKVV